ncbi:MAG: DUF4268 domain-containing protein [Actinomycetia bacterium]|nr:DUF4268 domain-containing protein [Actinomycetes bacterium]
MADDLGSIVPVNVRRVWENEQYHFTPWLARAENMALLSGAVGLELEVQNIEVAIGPYSADILAKDVGTGRYVVIENQFGKTNHDHLGKLLTYASVLDARAVIWISEKFTDEHQKTLDWLNDHTTEQLEFYGVTLELWQIDESRPAVRFNVVSRPSQMARQAAAAGTNEELSETRQIQLEFWTQVSEKLKSSKTLSSTQTPRPQYWFDVPLGRANIVLSCACNVDEGKLGVRVYIGNKVADLALPQLEMDKAAIEQEIGQQLLWNPNADSMDKIIALYREADLHDRAAWAEYVEWMVHTVSLFRKTFAPRVKRLQLAVTPETPPDSSSAEPTVAPEISPF